MTIQRQNVPFQNTPSSKFARYYERLVCHFYFYENNFLLQNHNIQQMVENISFCSVRYDELVH